MKIDINKIKLIPTAIDNTFGFCVFGEPDCELSEWINYWQMETEISNKFLNIYPKENFEPSLAFISPLQYEYVDGFSPNLNKHLHIGHASNLIIANALQHLQVGSNFIAILGDTLSGNVDKEDALETYLNLCKTFEYEVDQIHYASEKVLEDNSLLSEGTEAYLGTKIFEIGDKKIVGIKSKGQTSYFYQDVALAQQLNAPTLYLTGLEQVNHFNVLKVLFPKINHIGLGLVTLGGKKMSSSEGNTIMLQEFIDLLSDKFNNDIKLVYNIIAGYILKSSPESTKSINMDLIDNPKQSLGLYLSYTMAHIKSCGVTVEEKTTFSDVTLKFLKLKAQILLSPQLLFNGLVQHCKKINSLYETHYIKDNPENIKMFQILLSDLAFGMKSLGMFEINKV